MGKAYSEEFEQYVYRAEHSSSKKGKKIYLEPNTYAIVNIVNIVFFFKFIFFNIRICFYYLKHCILDIAKR